jgi:hypothetical protein
VLYCASQFPKVEITQVRIAPATGELLWIDATVANDRTYPTSSDRASQLGMAVKDKITVSSSDNVTILDLPEGTSRLDPLNPQATAVTVVKGKAGEFRLRGNDAQRFRCLAKMSGTSGWVEFQVESKYGGRDKKRVQLNVGGS